MKRQWRQWEVEEDEILREHFCEPDGPEEVARITGRTVGAVLSGRGAF